MVDAMEVSPKSSILSPVTLQENVDERFRKFPQGIKFTIRNNAFLRFVIKQIFPKVCCLIINRSQKNSLFFLMGYNK